MERIPAAAKAFYDSFNELHHRQPAAVVARPAPHGHRQECRRAVGRQFLGRDARPHRYQDVADDDHPVPGSGLSALSHRGRPEPQCVGQSVDDGSHRQVRSRARREWTMFDLPTRGTEIRHVSLLERDGVTKVIVPIYRDSKMGVDDACAARPKSRPSRRRPRAERNNVHPRVKASRALATGLGFFWPVRCHFHFA